MNELLVVMIFLVAIPLSALWRGFVLSHLWEWFAVPLGVAQIGYIHAVGLSLLVALFSPTANRVHETKDPGLTLDKAGAEFGTIFVVPLVFLVIGAMVHSLM